MDNLIRDYPYKEMDELSDAFLEWDDTIRLALNHDPSKAYGLSEGFWLIFSDLLQIKRNENISEDIISYWSNKFPGKLDEYNMQLAKNRKSILSAYITKALPDTEVQNIVRKMNDLSFDLAET